MSKKQPRVSKEQKVEIVKAHLVELTPISEVCEKYKIAPSSYYQWQKTFLDFGGHGFDTPQKKNAISEDQKRIKALEIELEKAKQKLTQKNEVVAELMCDHLTLKKTLGVL